MEEHAEADGHDDRGEQRLRLGDAALECQQAEYDRGEPARPEPPDEGNVGPRASVRAREIATGSMRTTVRLRRA